MAKQSKESKVLEHLQERGYITSIEAIEMYGATRLAAIIYCLRDKGYNIETEKMPFVDRFGNKSVYAKYVLKD